MTTEELSQQLEEAECDISTRLIYLVKEYPFIYDAKDPKHKDRNLLERTWSTIASQISLSIDEAKTKWQRLRNNFSKAIERRVKTPRSGSAATKLQKPWIYEADMEFLRKHIHYHRACSSSLAPRPIPAAAEYEPLSLHKDMVESEQSLESRQSVPRSSSPKSTTQERDSAPQSRKRDYDEMDSAVLSSINRASARQVEEDPAVGWFKSLLPMYNTLNPFEKLEFQSKVALELRSFMLAKERDTH